MCLVTDDSASGFKHASQLGTNQLCSENPFGREHQDNFATIRFSEGAHGIVNMTVGYWPIRQDGESLPEEPVRTFAFKLD